MKVIIKPMFVLYFLLLTVYSCNNEELFVEEALIPEDETDSPEDTGENVLLVDDTYVTYQNSLLIIDAYVNDKNIPSNFTITFTNPLNGTLAIDDKGTPDNINDDSVTYISNADFFGTNSFEYTICDATDSENCDTALVTIEVNEAINEVSTELKAFPSAYGAGAAATGGRGGVVVHVTNLNDSGTGSFREALKMKVPRVIVFDVSGVINLTTHIGLNAANSDVTIAGQTAPEGGITIAGNRGYFDNVDNLICRYIRFKGGKDISNDAFSSVNNITNQIYDHCSFAFGTDESASWYGTGSGDTVDNVTIQRCFFAESSKGSIFGSQYGVSATVGGEVSFLFNMFYNTGYRFPNIAGDNKRIDVINNIAWNVSDRLIRGNGDFLLNHIGNYYDYGVTPIYDKRLNLFAYDTGDTPEIYTTGNKIVAESTTKPLTNTVSEMNADNQLSWKFFQDGGGHLYGDQLLSDYFTGTQHALVGKTFTILSAGAALTDVTANVGCNLRLNADGSRSDNTDSLDADWLNQVTLNNHVSKLSSTNYNVPAITSVSRAGSYDTDDDGMPDTWEIATFGDLTKTGTADTDSDGYTDLEEFLNQVDI